MIDDGHHNLEIQQRAQSLAALLHTITLTSSQVAEATGLSLRASSRLLYGNLSNLSELRGQKQDLAQHLKEAHSLVSGILTELSSRETSRGIPEKERTYLLNSYAGLLDSLHSAIGALEPTAIPPDQGLAKQRLGRGEREASPSLRGKVVLITRPLSQGQNSAMMVERYGGLPVVIPMIEIVEPDDWHSVDHSIANLKGYDGVIFTSQNGVEGFLARIASVNVKALNVLATRRVYAVGEKTRACLEDAQIPVTLMPERFSAKGLASALQKEPLAGKRFLFPKGSLAKEEIPEVLRASHAVVDEVEVYKTGGATGASFAHLNAALKNREIDSIAFFSPSAVQNFAHTITPEHTRGSVIACIGPSTAEAAKSAGFARIITAPEATAESLIGALVRFFDR